MPKYARFYSATEAEAVKSFPRLCLRQTDAPCFSSDDAQKLAGLLDGTLTISSRPRNDINQPLFRPKPVIRSVEELVSNASGFIIARETVHRDKFVHHDNTSEESASEWKTRSRTPSSDERSPRTVRITTPSLSVRETASSDWSDDDMAHVPKRTHMNQVHGWVSFPDHYALYPDNVLQNMDTQFSKWSHDLSEGTTAVPFAMAQAPPDTHESLVKVDREFWITGNESANVESANSKAVAKAVLERAQKKSPKPLYSTKPAGIPKLKMSTASDATSKDDSSSKRAALIAKSKTAKESSLVISRSANQRRSAMHRNKSRRSIMPSPPPTARKLEPVKKQEAQTEESRPTILILDRKEDDQHRELDSALQKGTLDWSNDRHVDLLMKRLRGTEADNDEDRGRVVDRIEETEQAGKTQRLKRKARKMAKSSATK
ncbi:uncharacterized protein M421DRAFT_6913 [Didymella exigua CBS 183.55]|uniref:Uncharacterized protein n=1 Tax=Didymella exigua CBS 183.55 TaxID=1150837 RepID=A0A6A5RHD2_9PLEO|nr:uncharacterized protein M421DRAFT_6913 [Didymella exigua CBS 183.55]KAF1926650.1 hypothetical protein M421DRAFT_6913 [Didymella exigua CBS 183.55]